MIETNFLCVIGAATWPPFSLTNTYLYAVPSICLRLRRKRSGYWTVNFLQYLGTVRRDGFGLEFWQVVIFALSWHFLLSQFPCGSVRYLSHGA